MKTSRSLPWSELKVGIIIIAALALLAAGILQLGGKAGFFTSNYVLYMRLNNTLGLKVGSSVRLAGIDVGNVQDITFPKDPRDKKIIFTLEIQEKYMDRIREDSTANIRTLGLLGDKYVDIEVGSPGSPVLKEGGVISGGEETQLSRVLSGASAGLEGINTVIGQLNKILRQVTEGEGTAGLFLKDPTLYRELTETATSLEMVADDLHKGRGSLGKLVNDPGLYNNLKDVSAKVKDLVDKLGRGSLARLSEDEAFYKNLHDVSANLKDVSETGKALVTNLQTGSIARLSSDKEFYEKVDKISRRLDGVMARLEKGDGTAGKLLKDEALYNNMDKFFKDADALVLDIKQNPKRYIHISVF